MRLGSQKSSGAQGRRLPVRWKIRTFFERRLCFFTGGVCRFGIPSRLAISRLSAVTYQPKSVIAENWPLLRAASNLCRRTGGCTTRFAAETCTQDRSPLSCVFSQTPRGKNRLRPAADVILLRLPDCLSIPDTDRITRQTPSGFRLSENLFAKDAKTFSEPSEKASRPLWEQPSLAPSGGVS